MAITPDLMGVAKEATLNTILGLLGGITGDSPAEGDRLSLIYDVLTNSVQSALVTLSADISQIKANINEGGITIDTSQSLKNTLISAGINVPEDATVADLVQMINTNTVNKDALKTALQQAGVNVSDTDTVTDLVAKIGSIITLASGTQDATASTGDILSGKSAYAQGSKINGAMANRGAVSHSLGINGSYTIPQGYHNGSGRVTQSVPTIGAQTITPGTSAKTIAAGRYLSGQQTIAGDSNLIPANIAKGKSIFGVAGSHEAGIQFRADCANDNYHLVHDVKLATFTPYIISGSFTAPNGVSVPYTISLNTYTGPESVLLFVKPDGITVNNVVAVKAINYSRGSLSGYVYFRSEHVFSWNNPLLTSSYTVPGPSGGNARISGKGMLALQFPSPAPNDEYTAMTVNYVEAYYY